MDDRNGPNGLFLLAKAQDTIRPLESRNTFCLATVERRGAQVTSGLATFLGREPLRKNPADHLGPSRNVRLAAPLIIERLQELLRHPDKYALRRAFRTLFFGQRRTSPLQSCDHDIMLSGMSKRYQLLLSPDHTDDT